MKKNLYKAPLMLNGMVERLSSNKQYYQMRASPLPSITSQYGFSNGPSCFYSRILILSVLYRNHANQHSLFFQKKNDVRRLLVFLRLTLLVFLAHQECRPLASFRYISYCNFCAACIVLVYSSYYDTITGVRVKYIYDQVLNLCLNIRPKPTPRSIASDSGTTLFLCLQIHSRRRHPSPG